MAEQNQLLQVGGNLPASRDFFVFKPLLLLVLEGHWQLPQILQNVGTQVCTRNSRVRFQKNPRSCPKKEQANWKKRV